MGKSTQPKVVLPPELLARQLINREDELSLSELDGKTFAEAIAYLTNLSEEYPDTAKFDVAWHYEDGSSLNVVYKTLEDDREYRIRIEAETRHAQDKLNKQIAKLEKQAEKEKRKLEHERALYEELKAKFEPSDKA